MSESHFDRKKWWPRLLLVLASTLFACLLSEGLVLLLCGEQPKFPRHVVGAEFGVRINEPGAEYRHQSADVSVAFRINQQGMRADRDYRYEKAPDVQRILSLGDSFTVGYEVEFEDCFSSVLEADLRDRGYAVEVLNAGVSGYSNAEACVYLERELVKYEPDLILISFFGNDLIDNVRSNLFRVEDGQLLPAADQYIPVGKVGDFLNTNVVFNALSEYSNAFVLTKEWATHMVKRQMLQQNAEHVIAAGDRDVLSQRQEYEQLLTAKIFERLHGLAQERGIPLVIHSIPTWSQSKEALVEMFPLDLFDPEKNRVTFLSSKELLEPFVGQQLLYWKRSHGHWTPFCHNLAGRELARLIHDRSLLQSP